MRETTVVQGRGSVHRKRAVRSATTLLATAVAVLGVASGALAAAASPETSPATGTAPFESRIRPYTLILPVGWSVVEASQEQGSDQDLFAGPEGDARVGTATPEPGQTVADRVATNRADLPTGCTSDPDADWSTTLGGEEAIGWSSQCPNAFTMAVNTIHGGVGYRLSVSVPMGSEQSAAPLLEQMRLGFAFSDSTAPAVDGSADLATVEAALQGTWENAWHPIELAIATLDAAGIDSRDRWWADGDSTTTLRSAVKFQDGAIVQYVAIDGGPLEVGWVGTYRLIDDHTIKAIETSTFDRVVYEFTLRDDVLTIDVVSYDDPVSLAPQTALYETLPFTRVP
jgi:hypothetical protein